MQLIPQNKRHKKKIELLDFFSWVFIPEKNRALLFYVGKQFMVSLLEKSMRDHFSQVEKVTSLITHQVNRTRCDLG